MFIHVSFKGAYKFGGTPFDFGTQKTENLNGKNCIQFNLAKNKRAALNAVIKSGFQLSIMQ